MPPAAETTIVDPLAAELRRLRADLGLTLEEWAHRVGIPLATLAAYEGGRVTPPADRFLRILHATRRHPKPFRLAFVARAVSKQAAAQDAA